LKADIEKLKQQSKFRSRRIIELDNLQKMKTSKTTIQISVVINKDIKIEFTSTIKETFEEIYTVINSIIQYKSEFTLFITPPKKF
jgi:hypothetical protein